MRIRKRIPPGVNPSFAVVVDGHTEVWYLQMPKRNERNIRVNIKPEIPHKKSLQEQYHLVCDLSEKEFTKVFWIVDLDTVIKEETEASKSKISPLNSFKYYRENLLTKFTNVVVIVNNPCLEFWFLLHFKKTSKYFHSCSSVETVLKTYIKQYKKTQKFFTKQNDDIYLRLKPNLKKAIENATALGAFDIENSKKALCEMELLFRSEELKEYFE